MIRSKFRCYDVQERVDCEVVTLAALDDAANTATFSPSSTLTIQITAVENYGQFTPGSDYWLEASAV